MWCAASVQKVGARGWRPRSSAVATGTGTGTTHPPRYCMMSRAAAESAAASRGRRRRRTLCAFLVDSPASPADRPATAPPSSRRWVATATHRWRDLRPPMPESSVPARISRGARRTPSPLVRLAASDANAATALPAAATGGNDDDVEDDDDDARLYEELASLAAFIRRHDFLYYDSSSQPELSDDEFDALCRREEALCAARPDLLRKLEDETGLGARATRCGGRVGPVADESEDGDPSSIAALPASSPARSGSARAKRRHLRGSPMLSLDNAMDAAEVVAWLNRARRRLLQAAAAPDSPGTESDDDDDDKGVAGEAPAARLLPESVDILAEPKMDGLSLSLRYRRVEGDGDGGDATAAARYELLWAATRGDGTRGEDVTEAVRAMGAAVPTSFLATTPSSPPRGGSAAGMDSSWPNDVEVRGEVVLPRTAFERLRREAEAISAAEEEAMAVALAEEREAATFAAEKELAPPIDDHDDNRGSADGAAVASISSPTKRARGGFSNARNAAAGILLRSKDDGTDAEKAETRRLRSELRFYAYGLAPAALSDGAPEREEEGGTGARSNLKGLGFAVPDPAGDYSVVLRKDREVALPDIDELVRYHERIMSSRAAAAGVSEGDFDPFAADERPDFDVDGAVYKLTSPSVRSVLGASSRAPRWAAAHKFPPRSAVTRIVGVEVQVGRTGALTPVAVLDPVDLGGASVGRASLHNFRYAAGVLSEPRSSLASAPAPAPASTSSSDGVPAEPGTQKPSAGFRSGASVLVSRAGDVIPQVVRRVEIDGDDDGDGDGAWVSLEPPPTCPACGHATVFELTSHASSSKRAATKEAAKTDVGAERYEAAAGGLADAGGQVLRCSGPQLLCPPRTVGALSHAFSRAGMDVRGLSEARLRQLADTGLISVPADVFRIVDEDREDSMKESVADLPGWGPKSAANLANAVRSVAEEGVALPQFIYSLGIRHVGAHTSELVAAAFGNVEAFLEEVERVGNSTAGEEDIDRQYLPLLPFPQLANDDVAKGIGPVTVEALIAFANEEALVDAARRLAIAVPVRDEALSSPPAGGHETREDASANPALPWPLAGISVVFTGAIPGMTRSSAQAAAKELGARSTPGSVSGSTDLVVVGEKGGKKADAAARIGVRTMEAEEFIRVLEDARKTH